MITLYQKDHRNQIRVWKIDVKHHISHSEIIIEAGLLNGKLVTTVTPINEGSNIGKANEKSIRQQADFDAQTEINKKVKTGYVDDINNVKAKSETATIKKPMKGEKYHPKGKNKALTLDKLGIRDKYVGIQRKLDGWRYRIFVSDSEIIFYTSSGDVTLGFNHIEESIRSCYDKFVELYGLTEFILDGEIYHHGLGFQAVASACGSTKHLTNDKFRLRNQMQFHLFDICTEDTYQLRQEMLETFYSDCVKEVYTYYLHANEKEIDEMLNTFLSEGYEGLMIRQLTGGYEYKRTKQLIKYKPLIDDEFEIVGFNKSITGETLGSLKLRINNETFDSDLKDEFGTDKMKKQIWDNKNDYLGKIVTVEFLEYTDDGIPRHPRAKSFRSAKNM